MSRQVIEAIKESLASSLSEKKEDNVKVKMFEALCLAYEVEIANFKPVTACINYGESEGDISVFLKHEDDREIPLDEHHGDGQLFWNSTSGQ